jgi:hypothetical protein
MPFNEACDDLGIYPLTTLSSTLQCDDEGEVDGAIDWAVLGSYRYSLQKLEQMWKVRFAECLIEVSLFTPSNTDRTMLIVWKHFYNNPLQVYIDRMLECI